MCRKEREGRFEPVEEEESLFSIHRLPTFNHRKKVNLAWKREEMPDSHNFLYYRTEILSHPDLRPMSQHQFELILGNALVVLLISTIPLKKQS